MNNKHLPKIFNDINILLNMEYEKVIESLIKEEKESYDYPIIFNIKINKNQKFKTKEEKIEHIDYMVNKEVQKKIPIPITVEHNNIYYNIRWVQDIEIADDIYDLYYNKKLKVYKVKIYGYLKKIENPVHCILLKSSSYKNLP